LLDQKLPDVEGHTLCPAILKQNDQTKIIFITAYPSFESAVTAIKTGAYDYLSKPFELEHLDLAIQKAFRTIDLETVEQFQKYKRRRVKKPLSSAATEGFPKSDLWTWRHRRTPLSS
jgi:two-component system NtrC family response regulator